ncbi:MAG: hypothetical protein E7473_03950 [Ruminococcaceae bacterium]|nr:hypothetical protein [Oscillospiraceae bacterium]
MRKEGKTDMKRIKKNDLLLKLLSLFLAIFIWVYVAGTNNFQEEYMYEGIEPVFLGEEDLKNSKNLELISKGSVNIEVSGSYSDLIALNKSDIKIEANLSSMGITEPGTYYVPYTVELPSAAYVIEKKEPQEIKVEFERKDTKMIDVIVNTDRIAADGYVVYNKDVKISPKQIGVTGFQEDIDKIDHATINTGKKDAKSEVKGEFSYKFYDEKGNCLENISVTTDCDKVSVSVPVLKTKKVPLRLEVQGETKLKKYVQYTLDPKELEIAGDEEKLADIDSLVVGTVNLADAFSEEEKICTINTPDEIMNVSGVFEAKAEVELVGMESKTIMASFIRFKGIKDENEEKVRFITTNLPVTIYAPTSEIENIGDDDIIVTVDLSNTNLTKGEHSAEAKVEVVGISDVIVKKDEYLVRFEVS